MMFFFKPIYPFDGGYAAKSTPPAEVHVKPERKKRRKKRSEFVIEQKARTVIATEAAQSILEEVAQKRRAKRVKGLKLLMKFMFDD